jgi:hypothetical protein
MLPYFSAEFTKELLKRCNAAPFEPEDTPPPEVRTEMPKPSKDLAKRGIGRYSQALIFLAHFIRFCLM